MTSRAGVADHNPRGSTPAPRRWVGLAAVPALALVAVLVGPVSPVAGGHAAASGPRLAAGQTAAAAAAVTTSGGEATPGSTVAVTAPTPATAPGPADLTAADTAPPGLSAPSGDSAGPAVERRRPPASGPAAAPAEPADSGRPPATWAVIVGINRYPRGDHDLHTAAADARDVDDALAGYGVAAAHRLLLLDGDATAPGIRSAVGWLTARAAPQDTAVLFFAGHAAHVGTGRRDARPEVALIAADDVAVPQSQLAGLLAPLRARSAWLGMAACYGAEFDGLLAPGRLLTAAAGRGQLAYESDALPHSYLVEYMVQRAMIEGDAARSVEDSFQWARAQIAQRYPGREPTMIDDRSAPLVLGTAAGRPGTEARSTPAGSPAGAAPGRSGDPGAPAPRPSPPPPASAEPGGPPGDDGCTHVGDAVRLCGR